MKYIFGVLLLLHGLIHVMGYIKAFKINEVAQLSLPISKHMGLLFLLTAVLFTMAFILFLMHRSVWIIVVVIAIIISQLLIITYWQDAKFGTIANGIILIVALLSFASWNFKNSFKNDSAKAYKKAPQIEHVITEEDLDHLPSIVKKYLHYVGVIGKPSITNFTLTFHGEMRGKEQAWFPFTAEQHSFISSPTRLFYMDAKIKRLPTAGYHLYADRTARMQIKLLSLFSVVDIKSPELYTSETVTFFNDLCLFAPGALIDDRITWEVIDATSVKATFKNKQTSISAILYFNTQGQLINFESEDRYDINAMRTYRFSTPITNYKNFNGFRLPSYGEAIWHYPDGEFVYGKFNVTQLEYNAQP